MTEDEQISKAAVELVAEFKRIKSKNRGGAGGARGGARCVLCDTTSKKEVVRSVFKFRGHLVEVYFCIDGCGVEFFQRLSKKLSEMFGRKVLSVRSY